jgi:predicted kinase
MKIMNKILYIVRGLPGSGKSTFAKSLGGIHSEADQFFMVDGEYKFDGSKIKDAHKWCQNEVNSAMILNHTTNLNNVIVVSNTFTQEWEMQPYLDMAKDWGYTVFSVIVENRHGGVNVHSVPDDKLEMMKNRFEVRL